jgi:predicted Rossmann fold flavoprotein
VQVLKTAAKQIIAENGAVAGVVTGQGYLPCGAAAICTGGKSYPLTGSTGAGYEFARSLGHTLIPPRPSLVPLESDDAFCAEMQGFAPKNVTLSAYEDDRLIYRELGEMLFTHFGVSGPLVLSASAHLRRWDKESYRLYIDLKPALDEQKLDARILRDIIDAPNKDFDKIVSGLVHRSMVNVILDRLKIEGDLKANSVTKEQRHRLCALLKSFELSVTGPRPVSEAIVTSGGVKVSEVQPSTMASRLVPGLYFAGEILDVDAYTGGFNLQIAWATGRQAGLSAKQDGGCDE